MSLIPTVTISDPVRDPNAQTVTEIETRTFVYTDAEWADKQNKLQLTAAQQLNQLSFINSRLAKASPVLQDIATAKQTTLQAQQSQISNTIAQVSQPST